MPALSTGTAQQQQPEQSEWKAIKSRFEKNSEISGTPSDLETNESFTVNVAETGGGTLSWGTFDNGRLSGDTIYFNRDEAYRYDNLGDALSPADVFVHGADHAEEFTIH
ncbi:MAG: hypothetical protein M1314_00170 [Firmicutes bacterium]|nr:hypothetical protein [Bacillota bacterium]